MFCLCTVSLWVLSDCHYSHTVLEVAINSRKHYIPASCSCWDSCCCQDQQRELWDEAESLGGQEFEPRCTAAQAAPSAGDCQHLISGTAERSQCSPKGDLRCRKLCEHPGNCQGGKKNWSKRFLRCRWAVSWAEGRSWTGRTSSDVAVGVWHGHVCCYLFHLFFSGFLPCCKTYRKCIAGANLVLGGVQ